MKKLLGLIEAIAVVVVFTGSGQAALEVRGLGTITVGGSGGYQLIYDDLLDITWLDYTHPYTTWYDQMAWATGLEVSFGGQTYENWRLPRTVPVNGFTYVYALRNDGSSDYGWNISAPGTVYEGSTASEMAHLYYTSLGNLAYYGVDGDLQPGYGLQNAGPFDNLQAYFYWSGTEIMPDSIGVWGFAFHGGVQYFDVKDYGGGHGLAVLNGDVPAVPIPGGVWLLGSGLVAMGALRGRRQTRRREQCSIPYALS